MPRKLNEADLLSRLSINQQASKPNSPTVSAVGEYIQFEAKESVPVALVWKQIKDYTTSCDEIQ